MHLDGGGGLMHNWFANDLKISRQCINKISSRLGNISCSVCDFSNELAVTQSEGLKYNR